MSHVKRGRRTWVPRLIRRRTRRDGRTRRGRHRRWRDIDADQDRRDVHLQGPFAPFYEATLLGAAIAGIEHGGTPVSKKPSDFVKGITIGGHPVTFVKGCSDATPDVALAEARRLVEQVKVDILIGPLSGSEGIAIANYSEEATEQHIRQRHLGRAGHDAQGPVAELLPVPHGRGSVDGRHGRLRLQHAQVAERRHDR